VRIGVLAVELDAAGRRPFEPCRDVHSVPLFPEPDRPHDRPGLASAPVRSTWRRPGAPAARLEIRAQAFDSLTLLYAKSNLPSSPAVREGCWLTSLTVGLLSTTQGATNAEAP